MRIGELAQLTGVPTVTLRFYEREGLLTPAARSDGNYRVYSECDVERVRFILRCRAVDMALGDIRSLSQQPASPGLATGQVDVDSYLSEIDRRMIELKQLRDDLCRRSGRGSNASRPATRKESPFSISPPLSDL